jgi:hypothetical protein
LSFVIKKAPLGGAFLCPFRLLTEWIMCAGSYHSSPGSETADVSGELRQFPVEIIHLRIAQLNITLKDMMGLEGQIRSLNLDS